MFTSRKQKILRFFMKLKEAERKGDFDSVRHFAEELKRLQITENDKKIMEIEKYFD